MTEYDRAMKEGRYIDAVLALSNDGTMPMKNAMIHIDAAIKDLEAQHNRRIDERATNILRHVYDWLDATAQMLDDMDEIEQIGEQQR